MRITSNNKLNSDTKNETQYASTLNSNDESKTLYLIVIIVSLIFGIYFIVKKYIKG